MNRSKLIGDGNLAKCDMTPRAHPLKKLVFCLIFALSVCLYQHVKLLHYKGVITQQNIELVEYEAANKANHAMHIATVSTANMRINSLLQYIQMREQQYMLDKTIIYERK